MPMIQNRKTSSFPGTPGILLINKPAGKTSFQSLSAVKQYFQTKRVGHTGTLDKFARGLMIVLVGKLTKLNPVFSGMDKVYEGVISFGEETDTLDPEGKIIHTASVPSLSVIEDKLTLFTGDQEQIPPLYSAIHVNGKRSWRLARQGVEIEMKSRPVRIDSLEIIDWQKPNLTLRVSCSSGTYIRSLARDLALSCESRGYLSALNRTKVGGFALNEARSPEENNLDEGLYSLYEIVNRLPFAGRRDLSEEETEKVRLGIPPDKFLNLNDYDKPGEYPLFNKDRSLAAMLERHGEKLSYRFVM